jgi:hypothetical protein
MAATQKPFNQSILAEKSGPPAWKQLPTWYQISENDHSSLCCYLPLLFVIDSSVLMRCNASLYASPSLFVNS